MKKYIIFICSLFLIAGCSKKEHDINNSSGVIAVIDGENIALSEFESYKDREKVLSQPDKELIEGFIEWQILLTEAKKQKISVSDNEIKNYLSSIGNEQVLIDNKNKIESEKLKEIIKGQIIVDKLIKQNIFKNVAVSNSEVLDYFNKNKSEFKKSNSISISQIVVKDPGTAKNIKNRLLNGNIAFDELAKQYSISPERAKGGYLGEFDENSLPKYFSDAVKNIETGKISDVIKTSFGYHILKVVARNSSGIVPFDKAKISISKKILNIKKEEKLKEWIGEKMKKVTINKQFWEKIKN